MDKNPEIVVLLDNSESVTLKKENYNGKISYENTLSQLGFENKKNIDFQYYKIGSSFSKILSPDSLNYLDTETNFSDAFASVLESIENASALILLSDGIFTYGKDPSIQISNLSIPLYTIALGDTTKVMDISVKNISTNSTGYTDTRHVIEVEIAETGFKNQQTDVQVLDSRSKIITSKKASFNADGQSIFLDFEIELKEAGLQQFNIHVVPLEGEWSRENNEASFSIDVLDSKTKILYLGYEIHPDIKAICSLLEEDKNIELSAFSWLSGNNFIEGKPDFSKKYDLIIIHGLPHGPYPSNLIPDIQHTPTLFIQLPKSVAENGNSDWSTIRLLKNETSQVFQIGLHPLIDGNAQPIMDLPETNYNRLSPIIGTIRGNPIQLDAVNLFAATFDGIETQSPVISIQERGNIRRAEINGWGWYKMVHSFMPPEREFIEALISNLVTWTSNDPDERRLKIKPVKNVFSIAEKPVINASLVNESGNIEPDGSIEVKVTSENRPSQVFNMLNNHDGTYNLELPHLSTGLYSFEATARKGDHVIDSGKGEFLVEKTNKEFVNTIRNDALLKNMALQTKGKFFEYTNVHNFWDELEHQGILETKKIKKDAYFFPVRSVWWFIIVLLFLGTEWVIRKFYSLT